MMKHLREIAGAFEYVSERISHNFDSKLPPSIEMVLKGSAALRAYDIRNDLTDIEFYINPSTLSKNDLLSEVYDNIDLVNEDIVPESYSLPSLEAESHTIYYNKFNDKMFVLKLPPKEVLLIDQLAKSKITNRDDVDKLIEEIDSSRLLSYIDAGIATNGIDSAESLCRSFYQELHMKLMIDEDDHKVIYEHLMSVIDDEKFIKDIHNKLKQRVQKALYPELKNNRLNDKYFSLEP